MLKNINCITSRLLLNLGISHQFLKIIGFAGKGKLELRLLKKPVELIIIGALRFIFKESFAKCRQVGVEANYLIIDHRNK